MVNEKYNYVENINLEKIYEEKMLENKSGKIKHLRNKKRKKI